MNNVCSLTDLALSLGQPCFPCRADKRPLTAHGFKDASADPGTVRRLFAHPDAALIGLPTGPASGVVVVDVDTKGEANGRAWLDANWHRLPDTRLVHTPSGGLHLYFLQPEGVRVPNSQSKLAPGVDVRGDGGYVCLGGDYMPADDTAPATVPDWLLPLVEERKHEPAPAYVAPARMGGGGDEPYTLSALDKECEAIRAAPFGEQEATLNEAAFKMGGYVAGGVLRESTARAALMAAARSMPSQNGREKWQERDLYVKVDRGLRAGARSPKGIPEREEKPESDDLESHPAREMIFRAFESFGKQNAEPIQAPPGIMDVDGALKLILDECNRTAIRPQPMLALGAAICAVGTLAGRRYATLGKLRTNVYVIAIADSGGGKDHAAELVMEAFYAAGLQRYLGGSDITSGRGAITSLEQHPARMFWIDEFGHFLKSILGDKAAPARQSIRKELLELYSRAKSVKQGTEYANKKENERVDIQNPHACIYGTTTPSTFWGALEGGSISDGLLARLLVFASEDNKPPRNKNKQVFEADPESELSRTLQAIARGAEGFDYGNIADNMLATTPMKPYTVPMTPEADALHDYNWDNVEDDEAAKHKGTDLTSIINRMAENALKLALIRAVGRNPARPTIEKRDVQWGWLVAQHCIKTMIHEAGANISETVYQKNYNTLLNIIRKRGPITMKGIINAHTMPSKDREEILRSLEAGGRVRRLDRWTGPKGGKPSQAWVAMGKPGVDWEEDDGDEGAAE